VKDPEDKVADIDWSGGNYINVSKPCNTGISENSEVRCLCAVFSLILFLVLGDSGDYTSSLGRSYNVARTHVKRRNEMLNIYPRSLLGHATVIGVLSHKYFIL
jgi:hypothetical protein